MIFIYFIVYFVFKVVQYDRCRFVDTHYQLVPYLLDNGAAAMDNNVSAITPLADSLSINNDKVRKIQHCKVKPRCD